jgi:hypothetical protein
LGGWWVGHLKKCPVEPPDPSMDRSSDRRRTMYETHQALRSRSIDPCIHPSTPSITRSIEQPIDSSQVKRPAPNPPTPHLAPDHVAGAAEPPQRRLELHPLLLLLEQAPPSSLCAGGLCACVSLLVVDPDPVIIIIGYDLRLTLCWLSLCCRLESASQASPRRRRHSPQTINRAGLPPHDRINTYSATTGKPSQTTGASINPPSIAS